MEQVNMKTKIKNKAVELFSEKGFHGTSIREIAKEAECSLPMLYYYFNNKNTLYEEIVYQEFTDLIERLNNQIPKNLPVEEMYIQAVTQRKELNRYDKAVYKLAMKTWLGFEGNSLIRDKLLIWVKDRFARNKAILTKHFDINDIELFTIIILRVFENITERIILLDEDIPDEDVKKEFQFLFNTK